ncbi:hypothetical protein [uncultured Hymenobacter sp.]
MACDILQKGPDHVDAHRSPAFVISPYTRHSTSGVLRTWSRFRAYRL